MSRRFFYVINPAAGGGRGLARWEGLQARLRRRGLAGPHRIATSLHEAAEVAADAAGNCDVVVATGGDGTALAVATGLARQAERPTALGILPVGSGNDAAAMSGTPTIDAAIEALAGGTARAIDGIEVTCLDAGRPVIWTGLVFVGTGFAADILAAAGARTKRRLGGRLAYALGFLRALPRFRPSSVKVRWDGGDFTGDTVALVAANHTHAGGGSMQIGPGAVPDDGRFDASIIRALGRCEIVRQFAALTRGTHVRHPAVSYFRATRMDVEAEVPARVVADGETIGWTPAEFRLRPLAFRMIGPPHPA